MMNNRDDKEPSFKVVDKRRFDEDGQEREGRLEEESVAKSAPLNSEEPSEHPSSERLPLNFSMFVQSLAHQAMMGLGLVPWPDTKLIRQDFNLAREMIDLLQLIKTKTAGNLDKDEDALLSGLVYQLQVAFVEISSGPQSGNAGGSGSIIT